MSDDEVSLKDKATGWGILAVVIVGMSWALWPKDTPRPPVARVVAPPPPPPPAAPPPDMARVFTAEEIAEQTRRKVVAAVLQGQFIKTFVAESVEPDEANLNGPMLYIHSDKCSDTFARGVAMNMEKTLKKVGYRGVRCRGGDAWISREAVYK